MIEGFECCDIGGITGSAGLECCGKGISLKTSVGMEEW